MVALPRGQTLIVGLLALAVPLAGCFGGGDGFTPGQGFKETGKTVHLRMWVADLTNHEVYPGFNANLWAFCAEAATPGDTYSQNAIEHWAPFEKDGTLPPADAGKCSVPGPTLRVKQGDRVIVDFQNDHFHCHTIHWHGQHVPWESDGAPGVTQDSVCKGQVFKYDFIAERAGTLWYHCHVDTQFHVMQGLFGAIIVEPQETKLEPKDIDREYVLVLNTYARDPIEATPERLSNPHGHHGAQCGGTSGTPNCQNPPVDVTPDVWSINGRSYPDTMKHAGDSITLKNGVIRNTGTLVYLEEGERIRLRLINAGETVETIHPHGHDMYVTHRDGNPLPKGSRFWVDTLTIGPAERYDVVIEGNNPGPWMLHTHVGRHEANDQQAPGGMHTMIVYKGYEDKMHQFAAELPGGIPYTPPQKFPEDARTTAVRLANGADVAVSWDGINVERACAVKSLTLFVKAQASNGALQAVNDLRVSVTDPNGTEVATIALGAEINGNWTQRNVAPFVAQNGTYAVTITGRAVDTRVDLDAFVDYYNTLNEAVAGGVCGLGQAHLH
jgi:FtsP/CotA-like multicopper oxidase with cupredoxin domain